MQADLQLNTEEGMVNWSKHLKHENPDFSPTFQKIIAQLVHTSLKTKPTT